MNSNTQLCHETDLFDLLEVFVQVLLVLKEIILPGLISRVKNSRRHENRLEAYPKSKHFWNLMPVDSE